MDVERLSVYLAMDRRHALATNRPLPDRTEGAALFADIVGFTLLTDTLVATLGPRRGAEELIWLLDAVYDALIAQVHRYGGSVVGFSGDGLTCWFDRDAGLRATACGLALHRMLRPFASVPTHGADRVTISLKVAITCGSVRRLVVGDPQVQRLDLLAGATLERLACAEQQAAQGELVVGPEVVQNLGERLAVVEWRAGFGVVAGLAEEVLPAPWPDLDLAALSVEAVRSFLLTPVYERLAAGQAEFLAELRPAVALFQCFGGLDYDTEEASARLGAYVCWVQSVLKRYGGYLLQLTSGEKGNYLYASFGALTVHEDDAGRAVAAAWELQCLPPELGFITGVQVGISQGRVRAGAYGSRTRRTYGAQGDEVNVAARLMQAAPPGEIRCSGAIYEAAEQSWVFEALPPVEVKGKAEPLPVYRPLRRRQERRARVAGALVGRQVELATLVRLLAETVAGRRRVVLLEGEAGIGKSRLVAELARLAHARNMVWLEGAGQSIEQGTPYRAWRDLLAAYFGLKAHMDPAEQQHRVRERVTSVDPTLIERIPLLNDILRLEMPETTLTRGFAPKLRRESLTWLVVDLLRDAALRRPLVIALEDAHWLDSLSWELALAVGRALYDRPLLLVLALRPLEEQALEAYTSLASLEGAETVHLEALPADETVALAAAHLGLPAAALPADVADLIRERAGGNPFFAEELTHALRDSGALVVEEGACALVADMGTLCEKVPVTVEGVVLSRIDRLPLEEQLTLKVAAVVGRSFLYRTVRDVHPRQVFEDLLRAHLDDLARRDLTPLEALEPELTYVFKHIITQEVAYDTLLFAQRRELHRAVAGWYERVYAGNLGLYYPLLVHHWHEAEEPAQERHYAKLAGEQAAAQYANAEAAAYLSRALELTPEDDLDGRYALLLSRVEVYHLQGTRAAERQDLHTLAELADTLDDDGGRAAVGERQARYALATSDYPAASTAAQETIRRAQAAGDIWHEAEGYSSWAMALRNQGDFPAARVQLQEALALVRTAQTRERLEPGQSGRQLDLWRESEASTLRELGNTFLYEGSFTEAATYYDESLSIARRMGNRVIEAPVLNNLGILSGQQGDFAKAKTYFEEALRLFRLAGVRMGEANATGNLGIVCRSLGDYAGARLYYGRAIEIGREIGNRLGEAVGLENLGATYRYLGDYARAKAYVEQSLDIKREIGERRGQGDVLAELALICHHLGDYRKAEEHGQQALLSAQEIGDRHVQGRALALLGHVRLQQGRLAEAADVYGQALALRRELGQPHLTMEPLTGLLRVSLALSDMIQAQAQAEEILAHLQSNTLDGADEPFRVYLACYQALTAIQDPRAQDLLNTAHALLQEQAAKIENEALRRSFVENVAAHREIAAVYQALQEAH